MQELIAKNKNINNKADSVEQAIDERKTSELINVVT